jgi:hypothetical protein
MKTKVKTPKKEAVINGYEVFVFNGEKIVRKTQSTAIRSKALQEIQNREPPKPYIM